MQKRTTRYGWIALTGLLCLFGFVLACKIRDGNRALAQTDVAPPVPVDVKETTKNKDPNPLPFLVDVAPVMTATDESQRMGGSFLEE